FGRDGLHLLLQAERDENAGAVGAELHAGAELTQLGGLLEDVDLDAALKHRERGGEAADARTCDQDFWRVWLCGHSRFRLSRGGSLAARQLDWNFALRQALCIVRRTLAGRSA